jgi:tyrosine-specific transport protein
MNLKSANSSIVYTAFFIAGNTIGAAILALPVMVGLAGFRWGVVGIVLGWIMMIATGLVLADQEILYEGDADFSTLYTHYFGKIGKFIVVVTYLFLFYGLLIAYFSGIGSVIANLFAINLPEVVVQGVPIVVLIGIIYFGKNVVYKFNTLFMLVLLLSFVVLIAGVITKIDVSKLFYKNLSFLPFALPAIICSYGFHNTIPAVCKTLQGDKKKIRLAIILGTLMPLILNIVLLFIITSIIPIANEHNTKVSLLYAFHHGLPATIPLSLLLKSKVIIFAGIVFTIVAIITSFLAVGTCLLGFVKDLTASFNIKNSFMNFILTFGVPIIIALSMKDLFLQAINVSVGIGAVTIFGLMPCLIALKSGSITKKGFYIIIFLLFAAVFLLSV